MVPYIYFDLLNIFFFDSLGESLDPAICYGFLDHLNTVFRGPERSRSKIKVVGSDRVDRWPACMDFRGYRIIFHNYIYIYISIICSYISISIYIV